MLTPVDISNRVFKGGIGYDKKDIESFMLELSSDYKELYSSNIELKDKIATLNESLQHYRSIEDSMQKALTLSEKTAEETVNAASDKARQINIEAEMKAETILADAKAELQSTKDEIYRLQQQCKLFKQQFTQILDMQKKLMDGEMVDIDLGADFEPSAYAFGGYSNSYNRDSSIGGGLGSGTYVGSNDNSGRERTNQEPAFDRGSSLNMDPFASAANGGGRFSRQTKGTHTNANRNATKQNGNIGLNMKKPGYNTVKRNITAGATSPVPNQTRTYAKPDTKPAQSVQNMTNPESVKASTPQKKAVPNATHGDDLGNVNNIKSTPNVTQTVTKEDVLEAIHATKPNETISNPIEETVSTPAEVVHTEDTYSGDIEKDVKESHMIDSEDNYGNSFDFVNEENEANEVEYDNEIKDDSYSGEVESKVREANMLDSEDNYGDSFDFVDEEEAYELYSEEEEYDNEAFDETYSGEVESRMKEANMLDSEDNYGDSFDFVDEEEAYGLYSEEEELEETYSGEVEDRVNESTMLESPDDYDEGFNFIVDEEDEEEIPTILTSITDIPSFDSSSIANNNEANDNQKDDFANDDVLVGDVEDKVNQANLIGNNDDDQEGFNFL